MSKKNVVINEFSIQIYADGRIDWNGLDEFLMWRLHHRPQEGFEPYAERISKFGVPPRRRRKRIGKD